LQIVYLTKKYKRLIIKLVKKFFIKGVIILVVASLTFATLHWYQTKQQMAKNVYALELPQGVTKSNLNNLNEKQKTQLNNQITQLLNRKINQLTIQSVLTTQPVVVVLTQNNQPILPTVPPPTSVPPSAIPPTSIPPTSQPTLTPTATLTSTPTPTAQPTPTLAFVPVSGSNFSVSNIDNGQGNWYTAKAGCANLGVRLPAMKELNVLYQLQANYNFQAQSYWSKEESGDEAYYIHFSNGFNNSMNKDFTFPYFRCVKGGEMTPTPTVASCTDSDGKNYFTKGVVKAGNQTLTDVCYHTGDAENVTITGCAGPGCNVKERYCQNTQAMTEIHPCPYNCGDGACIVVATPTLTPSPAAGELCSDSDGGRNFYIKGRTVPAPGYSSNQVGEDSCISTNQLNEYYCHEDNKHLAVTQPNCPAGCMSGVCLQPDACTDSDGGKNYYEKGFIKPAPGYSSNIIYWDKCINATMLEEEYCHPDGKHAAATQITCPGGYGCQDGVCLGGPLLPQPQCGDSDGGVDYEVKGRVVDKNGKEYFDHCVKDQVVGADPNYLAEYSCQYPASMVNVAGVAEYDPEEIFLITYNCSFGCQDGVCLSQPVSPSPGSCSDSDGGANYYLKGQLIDKNSKTYNDYCVKDQNASADPDYLAEYSCQSPASNEGVEGKAHYEQEDIYLITYDCPAGCSTGSCIVPASQGTRAGFSFTQEARESYQKQTGSNLVDDVLKIYFNGKKISGLKLDKEIKIQSLGSSGLKINYYNASTNEVVFGEKPPTKENLVNLIAVSLGDESLFLKPKTYEEEFKKINTEEINRQVFEPKTPTSPIPTVQQLENCTADWKEYRNDKFGFKFKIPVGWTDVTIDERQSETFIHRSLVSTTRPEEQMDPKYKLSLVELLASTSDLKTDENYGRWFDDNTGNQKKSTINFKGIKAEKYVDGTEMFCSSQTDQNPVNCSHRFERYYFKKGDIYYFLLTGFYTDGKLKEKNEAIIKCFLDSFELK